MADEAERLQTQRRLVGGIAGLIPLVGVAAVATNLMVQTRGNQTIALAIVENLSLGSIALIVAINLVQIAIPALVVLPGLVIRDSRHPPYTRSVALRVQLFAVVVGLFVLPWVLAAIGVLVIVIDGLLRRRRTKTPKGMPFEKWLAETPPPLDLVQRKVWVEGRKRLRTQGTSIALQLPEEEAPSVPARSMTEIKANYFKRDGELRVAQRPTPANAIFTVLAGAVSFYGFSAILLTVQFAPLEIVYSESQPEGQVGYVLDESASSDVFVTRALTAVTYLSNLGKIDSRQLCTVPIQWWSLRLLDLWGPVGGSMPDCPRDQTDEAAAANSPVQPGKGAAK